jgi:hypothetical protein
MELGFIDVLRYSLYEVYGNVIAVLPNIIGALLIFILGLIIAPLVGGVIKKIIEVTKIDALIRKAGVKEALGGFGDISVATIIGKLVKWAIIFASLLAAADILNWPQLSLLLNEVILYIPQVIIAVVVIAVGMVAGDFVHGFVSRAAHGVSNAKMLGKVAKAAVVVFSVLIALVQLGIAPSLIQILTAGIVFALALAFGLGGRDRAAEIVSKIR